MEFLKEILGEELYKQIETAINAHNGNEANKDKQVKLANLATGDYVGKGKHDALQALLDGKDAELTTANGLIAELKKGAKGNEEMQGKITAYETQVAELQKQLAETQTKSAIKIGFAKEGVVDDDVVEFLTGKLMKNASEKGTEIKADENGIIKGWDDYVAGLKTQAPKFFETKSQGNLQVLGDNRLPEGDGNRETEPNSLAEALQMQYESKN